MKTHVRIFFIAFVFIIALSFVSTGYSTFIAQDFGIYGYYVEFYDDTTYVAFIHEGEEYEFETETSNVRDAFDAVARHVGTSTPQLDERLRSGIKAAYADALEMK